MNIKQTVIDYLAQIFRPISIKASIKEWKHINYKNRLFKVSLFPNYEDYSTLPNEYKYSSSCLTFDYSKDSNIFIIHPGCFLAEIITGNLQFTFMLHNANIHNLDENIELTFNTQGFIPNRFIRMLHDFYFKDSSLEEGNINKEYWSKFVNKLPDETLLKLTHLSYKSITKFFEIKINKSPDYSTIKNDYIKQCNIDIEKTVSFIDEIKYHFMDINDQDFRIIHEKQFFDHIVDNRIWFTGNGNMSYPVTIFSDQCKKYTSFYQDYQTYKEYQENKELSNSNCPYIPLFKCEGGLYLNYLVPWKELYTKTNEFNFSWEWGIVGNNIYKSSYRINIEELILFEECLKHQGAEIEVKY